MILLDTYNSTGTVSGRGELWGEILNPTTIRLTIKLIPQNPGGQWYRAQTSYTDDPIYYSLSFSTGVFTTTTAHRYPAGAYDTYINTMDVPINSILQNGSTRSIRLGWNVNTGGGSSIMYFYDKGDTLNIKEAIEKKWLEVPLTQDTYLSQSSYSTNYGSALELSLGTESGNVSRDILLNFNLNTIPTNAIITEAQIHLYQKGLFASGTRGVDEFSFKINNSSWSESGVTWSNAPTVYGDFKSPPLLLDAQSGTNLWRKWDVTNLVKLMAGPDKITNGFRLSRDTTSFINSPIFYSNEGHISLKPRLIVRYEIPTNTINSTSSVTKSLENTNNSRVTTNATFNYSYLTNYKNKNNSITTFDKLGNLINIFYTSENLSHCKPLYISTINELWLFDHSLSKIHKCKLTNSGIPKSMTTIPFTMQAGIASEYSFSFTGSKLLAYRPSTGRIHVVSTDLAQFQGGTISSYLLSPTFPLNLTTDSETFISNPYYAMFISKTDSRQIDIYLLTNPVKEKTITLQTPLMNACLSHDGKSLTSIVNNAGKNELKINGADFYATLTNLNANVFSYNNAGTTTILNTGTNMSLNDTIIFNRTATGRFGSFIDWKVPKTGLWKIEAFGAAGGNGDNTRTGAGKGAVISALFNLNQNDLLKILVGQKGGDGSTSNSSGGGGGGGTFVTKVIENGTHLFSSTSQYVEPIVVAGGGNGSNWRDWYTVVDARSDNSTTAVAIRGSQTAQGFGNETSSYGRGGGGGSFTTSASTTSQGNGGAAFLLGAAGGTKGQSTSGDGGFGGGGGSVFEGGGGGGWSGGSVNTTNDYTGSYPFHGAGSYIDPSNVAITERKVYNTDHGFVKLTLISSDSIDYSPIIETDMTGIVKSRDEQFNIDWIPAVKSETFLSKYSDKTIYYEVFYFPDGTTPIMMADSITDTYFNAPLVFGGSYLSKIGVRSYVIHNNSKIYSEFSYTNSFTTTDTNPQSKIPELIKIDPYQGAHIEIKNKIFSTDTSWTMDVGFKTSESNYQRIFSVAPSGFEISVGNKVRIKSLDTNIESYKSGLNDSVQHIITLRKVSNSFYIYIDGVFDRSWTDGASKINTSLSTSTIIGNPILQNSSQIKPSIRLPRYWNSALSESKILENNIIEITPSSPDILEILTIDKLGKVKGMINGSIQGSPTTGVQYSYNFNTIDFIELPEIDKMFSKENMDFIREKINIFRITNGLQAVAWTDPVIIRNVTPLKAIHINELHQAINEVYSNLSMTIIDSDVKNSLDKVVLPNSKEFNVNKHMDFLKNALFALSNKKK